MVKVMINNNGEVHEFECDVVFGGVITDGDSYEVTSFVNGHISRRALPGIIAEAMCAQVKRLGQDEQEQMMHLIDFGSAVDKIVKDEMHGRPDLVAAVMKEVMLEISKGEM